MNTDQNKEFDPNNPRHSVWEAMFGTAPADNAELIAVLEGALVDDVIGYHSPEWVARARRVIASLKGAAASPVAGWVSVEERLPEHDEEDASYVWASWTGASGFPHAPRQGRARYIKALGWQPDGCQGWDWIVTHWQPLPLPPAPAATPTQQEKK